jgi:hypothetical protein
MSNRLNLFIFPLMLTSAVMANDNTFEVTGGYFAINAKTEGKSTSISNPSIFRFGYTRALGEKFNFAVGYSVLMSDFSGSDLGYGLDIGANYYFLGTSSDEVFKNNDIKVRRFESFRPYVGAAFYQRQFQATKNSYAGVGLTGGVEHYLNEKMNLKAEGRYINLSGSGESTATEMNLLVGVVFKF